MKSSNYYNPKIHDKEQILAGVVHLEDYEYIVNHSHEDINGELEDFVDLVDGDNIDNYKDNGDDISKLGELFKDYQGEHPKLDKETKEFIENLDNPVGKEFDWGKE